MKAKKTTIAAMTAAVAIVLGGLFAPAAVASSTEPAVSDEELVLGLVFGVGDFADEIGTAADVRATPEDTAAEAAVKYEQSATAVTHELLAEYGELAPALDLIREGDPALTEEAFATVGDVLDDYAASQVAHLDGAATAPSAGDVQALSPCGVAVVCWAYAAAAVHNTVVVTGAAAVVVAAALWCGAWAWCGSSAESASPQSELMREQLAVDVTVAAEAR
jgi:SdpC family antimicrobial peptide